MSVLKLRPDPAPPAARATGFALLTISRANEPIWCSHTAGRWLEEMRGGAPDGALPDVVQALVEAVRSRARAGGPGHARVPLQTPAGVWWIVEATLLEPAADATTPDDGGSEQVAILAQPPSGAAMAEAIITGMGFTPGERDLTELVLQGCSTKTIAEQLFLSPYTVQDRLKSIFEKAGVRSRRELVARLNPPQWADAGVDRAA
jgi:DNA-binding NarL/FixJ family response regulator